MSLFVQPTPAPAPKTTNTKWISLGLATIFVVMAVAQLYKFEEFPDVIATLGLPGGHTWAPTYAALFVAGEVLALPFLLRMTLSPAMRVVSMGSGWLVIAGWMIVTIVGNVVAGQLLNGGILGATIPVALGWWQMFIFVALGILAAWSAWGMWPCRRESTKR